MSNRLPRDLQNEILVSLPVKSLLRFQCVSKTWKSLITSPKFISLHVEHSESTDNYAHLLHSQRYLEFHTEYQLHHMDGSFSEFQKLDPPCQIGARHYKVFDCKGLLLIRAYCPIQRYAESLILWSPAIRMSMTLPLPCMSMALPLPCIHAKCWVYGFGFDHTSNDYKVLRLVFGKNEFFPPKAELYKLRTRAWETVRGVDDFQYVTGRNCTQAVVNGASHWLGYHKRDMAIASREFVVVLFHMSDKELRVMKLSDHLSSLHSSGAVLGVSGRLLSLMEFNRPYLSCNIWLMKEYGVVESWTKQFTIDSEGWGFWSKFSFRNNEKILGEKQNKLVLYDPKTHRFINLRIKAKGISFFDKNTFVESLVLLNEVNPIQTCQTCLKKGQWCDSEKGNEKKRKTSTREG